LPSSFARWKIPLSPVPLISQFVPWISLKSNHALPNPASPEARAAADLVEGVAVGADPELRSPLRTLPQTMAVDAAERRQRGATGAPDAGARRPQNAEVEGV